MSDGETMLAFQLKAAKIPFQREYRFAPPRRFRFDFVIGDDTDLTDLAVEVDGGAWNGGHRRFEQANSEAEKANLAVLRWWRVLHFTPTMVESGEALQVIQQALSDDT